MGVNENKLILNGKFLLDCVVPFSSNSANLPDLSPITFPGRINETYVSRTTRWRHLLVRVQPSSALHSAPAIAQSQTLFLSVPLHFGTLVSLQVFPPSWLVPLSCTLSFLYIPEESGQDSLLLSYKFSFSFGFGS